ncbi:MAG: twin arginine-targeting protein translocase TatC [Acidobacteria bacterium 21-70-11]|nr:MAG: twin arginine-targeting protein translocase TatC [Acidobacteria bacterium 21-70-11]OYW03189.1 MAG: twin arginine-targeting protein translocase TatC [Acidobacteria bacterium 37-71-11]HQT95571.1 twin-arginine translocase subunit TatC [Thermoanaerobaculaceae bacterium]
MADASQRSGDSGEELSRMTILEHLEELRKRIMWSIAAVIGGFLLCWYWAQPLFAWMAVPITQFLPAGEKLAFTGLVDPFMLYMKVALLAGIFVASPVILWQFWLFVSPALYRHERSIVVPFVVLTTVFFLSGGYFGYKIAFPMVVKFLLSVGQDFRQVITINEYFSMASKVILGLGLVFELPVLIMVLARFGIVTAKFLLKYFKFAVLVIFIIAAIITPTPDIPTQCVFALPMIGLYLLGVLVAWIFGKKRTVEES